MKPTTVIAGPGGAASNGIQIPINREYPHPQPQQHQSPQSQQYHPQQYATGDVNAPAYGSPRQQHQQQQHPPQQQQQQIPAHFQQGFGFEPHHNMNMDMDMDNMFPRTRLAGRMAGAHHNDPFAGFADRTRKRNSAHEPHSMATDGFSRYFDDDPDFGFPQFGSMGRRRGTGGVPTAADPLADEHDFFNRLPSEFRQYIPETFGHRRSGSNTMAPQQHAQPQQQQQQMPPPQHQQQQQPQQHPGGVYYQNYGPPTGATPPQHTMQMPPQSPSKKLCDAAIQTEDPASGGGGGGADQVDHATLTADNLLNQHGLRNTVDMGVKSAMDGGELHGPRSHSAPPPEQLQQIPVNGKRPTPPPAAGVQSQFGTQTSPQVGLGGQPQFQKVYYAPHQQPHPLQQQQQQQQPKQQTPPPPQTPGGTYIRTIPIFVEGRSEPIINAHKEIPNQNGGGSGTATASASARAFTPQQQQQQQQPHQQYYQQPQQAHAPQSQQHRPAPLNTQQAGGGGGLTAEDGGLPPQTPHTLDSIGKIQDIQRDVLDLMGKVEGFAGTRKDKEYAYLDEMLTRNLLKLDTIDTNGKDSIRLARKEAIKCIQASINVLEAKAEENARAAQGAEAGAATVVTAAACAEVAAESVAIEKSAAPISEATKEVTLEDIGAEEPNYADATRAACIPIPLPAPEHMQVDEQQQSNTETSGAKEPSPPPAATSTETASK